MKEKRHLFEVEITAIEDSKNPTRKDVEFIIHDFDMSSNYAFISKDATVKSLNTLNNMPIVAKYYDKSHHNASDDALGSHEVMLDRDRTSGEGYVAMGTLPIGVFTEPGRIETIVDGNGNAKEVVIGKGILWASRYPNIVGLLKEWVDSGIPVTSSMEILYDSYKVDNGVTEILSFCYEGHCLLNSEERGEHKKVYPAYDVSRLTKLVAEAADQEIKKEDSEMPEENKEQEVVEVEKTEAPKEADTEKEIPNEVQVDGNVVEDDAKKQQSEDAEDGKEDKVDSTKDAEIANLKEQIKELKAEIANLKSANKNSEDKNGEITEKLISLNSLVEELKPFKEKFEKAEYDSKLEEKKEFYSEKFEALNATEKFEEEDVQELIKKTVFENDESNSAKLQLNSMLVDMVTLSKVKKEKVVERELSSKRENLIDVEDSFEARYSN